MGSDKVALAFAAWLEAHKAYTEGARRLAIAVRTTSQMGMQPPEALVAEVDALKLEADRLLADAQAELKRGGD